MSEFPERERHLLKTPYLPRIRPKRGEAQLAQSKELP